MRSIDEQVSPTEPARTRSADALTRSLLVVGAAMVAWSAIIHLYLWGKEDGYRAVPTVGPLILAQGITGCVLTVAVVVVRRPVLALAGAAFMAGSVAALVKSINGGLFDNGETLDAPFVKQSLIVETIGLAAFAAAWILLAVAARSQGPRVK